LVDETERLRRDDMAPCLTVRRGKLQVILITSRESKRWIVPKGWPLGTPRGNRSHGNLRRVGRQGEGSSQITRLLPIQEEAAGPEAHIGGSQDFSARRQKTVEEVAGKKTRKMRWFSLADAAKRCSDPALGQLLRKLETRLK
jgi:hypothetical protein